MISILQGADADLILGELRREARSALTVQEACQGLMQGLFARLPDSLQLTRAYITVPFQDLPETDQVFARRVADNAGTEASIKPDTKVLSLLGTAGVEPAWRDRYQSREHLAIPLLSPDFVAGIPMISGLVDQLGSSARWYRQVAQSPAKDPFSVFTSTFFVPDARTGLDNSGRLLIPAQDFVRQYGIRSVFGVGGQFQASGLILICVFFSSLALDETPPWLLRIPVLLASVTQPLLSARSIYPTR